MMPNILFCKVDMGNIGLYICLHDGVMVTERGVEFPYPPCQGIRVVH